MWGSITICIANLSLKVKWLICALETHPIELMSKWLAAYPSGKAAVSVCFRRWVRRLVKYKRCYSCR